MCLPVAAGAGLGSLASTIATSLVGALPGMLLSGMAARQESRENDRVANDQRAALARGEQARVEAQQRIARNIEATIPQYEAATTQQVQQGAQQGLEREYNATLAQAQSDRAVDPTGGRTSTAYDSRVLNDLITEATESANRAKWEAAMRAPQVVQDAQRAGLTRVNDESYRLAHGAQGATAASNLAAATVQPRPQWTGALLAGAGNALSGGLTGAFNKASTAKRAATPKIPDMFPEE